METERWLSATDVAAIVGKTPKTVRNWARRGLLRGVRFGGRDWAFLASDVEAALKRALPPDPNATPLRSARPAGRAASRPVSGITPLSFMDGIARERREMRQARKAVSR